VFAEQGAKRPILRRSLVMEAVRGEIVDVDGLVGLGSVGGQDGGEDQRAPAHARLYLLTPFNTL